MHLLSPLHLCAYQLFRCALSLSLSLNSHLAAFTLFFLLFPFFLFPLSRYIHQHHAYNFSVLTGHLIPLTFLFSTYNGLHSASRPVSLFAIFTFRTLGHSHRPNRSASGNYMAKFHSSTYTQPKRAIKVRRQPTTLLSGSYTLIAPHESPATTAPNSSHAANHQLAHDSLRLGDPQLAVTHSQSHHCTIHHSTLNNSLFAHAILYQPSTSKSMCHKHCWQPSSPCLHPDHRVSAHPTCNSITQTYITSISTSLSSSPRNPSRPNITPPAERGSPHHADIDSKFRHDHVHITHTL